MSVRRQTMHSPRFWLLQHLFSFTELQFESRLKTETHGQSIVTLWILWEPHWKTQTQKHTHTHTHTHSHVQRTCRGASLLVPCRLGGGRCSWHAKSWRWPKPRGTVSIVRWALFSRYNQSAGLWKHSLNPNSPSDWRDFTYFLIDK